ncbi:MAG: Acyl-[acyl-carrier-protein]--UDP-N-acetylglucosamine O-acyltransferase [Phycisphaerae bacterium]|nr:Acyl-[acyl-carrier-protein]--UDP-N-acetylglucosamine O-acyltransferase [Phycisphaerae bacterium]
MIHPTAIIDRQAELAADVEIGPYAVVEGSVRIGSRTVLRGHSYICGWTTIGTDCQIHPFSVVGNLPQDYKYKGEESYVTIGDGSIIREYATVHRGTQAGSTTRVGKNCMIMAKAHVGHNCQVGDGVVIANDSECSGHVEIGNNTVISGHVMIHQFTRIGRRVMICPGAPIRADIPPFFMTDYSGGVASINRVGLQREGLSADEIMEVRRVYKLLYHSKFTFVEAVHMLKTQTLSRCGMEILEFITSPTKCGIAGPPTLNCRSRRALSKNEPVDETE